MVVEKREEGVRECVCVWGGGGGDEEGRVGAVA